MIGRVHCCQDRFENAVFSPDFSSFDAGSYAVDLLDDVSTSREFY